MKFCFNNIYIEHYFLKIIVPVFSLSVASEDKNKKPKKAGLIERDFLTGDDSAKLIKIVDSINLE